MQSVELFLNVSHKTPAAKDAIVKTLAPHIPHNAKLREVLLQVPSRKFAPIFLSPLTKLTYQFTEAGDLSPPIY